jgi:hypothetical protein
MNDPQNYQHKYKCDKCKFDKEDVYVNMNNFKFKCT